MKMQDYLIETFQYNDYANKLALAKMRDLPEKDECIRVFSHLINSMNKWLARIEDRAGYLELDWWGPQYEFGELEPKWEESLALWIEFIETKTEGELGEETTWFGPYGGETSVQMTAKISDIALQLNYHSIHHRAQIQYLIRQQGLEPDFVDYIGTKYRRLG